MRNAPSRSHLAASLEPTIAKSPRRGRPPERQAPQTTDEWRERAPDLVDGMSDDEIEELSTTLERLAFVVLKAYLDRHRQQAKETRDE